jgi:DNA-binding IclR family transcriptional regulator
VHVTTTDKPDAGIRNNSTSLRRALTILLEIGEDSGHNGYSLSDLCRELQMNKSTLLRLIAPLVDTDLVRQNPDTGRYFLGWRTIQLGQRYLEGLDLNTAAHDILEGVMAATSETVHLVITDLPYVVYVDKVDSPRPVRMHSRIGSQQPMHCTAVGKAILAFSNEAVLSGVLELEMVKKTPNTLTTPEALAQDLIAVRERGYAIDDVENEVGLRCVAAPIFDHTGSPVSAISVSGPVARVTRRRVTELGPRVAAAADEISRRLGAPR